MQNLVFTCLLGRTDPDGRTLADLWADRLSASRVRASVLSVVGIVVVANLLYGAVFAPHLVTKLQGRVTAGPTAPLFRGVRNQPP